MTLKDLEGRVAALERTVADLEKKVNGNGPKKAPWWISGAGRFANDPIFDEIVRLGREYRESLRPGARKKQRKVVKKDDAHP